MRSALIIARYLVPLAADKQISCLTLALCRSQSNSTLIPLPTLRCRLLLLLSATRATDTQCRKFVSPLCTYGTFRLGPEREMLRRVSSLKSRLTTRSSTCDDERDTNNERFGVTLDKN